MCEPLVVTAYLQGGVVSDPWLPLDGMLAFRLIVREYAGWPEGELAGECLYTTLGRSLPMLPLATVTDGPFTYHHCSFAEWGQPYAEGRDYWHKLNDDGLFLDLLSPRVKRIFELGGRYKTKHMPLYYRVAPWVRWYVVGDAAALRDLLHSVKWLGKHKAAGWGRVRRWEVTPAEADYSLWRDGVPQRSIPITPAIHQLGGLRRMHWGYRPFYYEACNQTLCYIPEKVRIAEG